ncbi:hypothetical protein [Anabaena sp. UHCC 0451]|nr:hypothetical protein [Anabaena sp. UHCC 0451]MEA5577472.1 hypothetical protein [Anabaena sp. UHCC 0451]
MKINHVRVASRRDRHEEHEGRREEGRGTNRRDAEDAEVRGFERVFM